MPSTNDTTRRPWNLGRLIGPKQSFKPKHIWVIRTQLQHEGRTRDLALFHTAIDSKVHGGDHVRLRVADVHLGDGVRLPTASPCRSRPPLLQRRPGHAACAGLRTCNYTSVLADSTTTTIHRRVL